MTNIRGKPKRILTSIIAMTMAFTLFAEPMVSFAAEADTVDTGEQVVDQAVVDDNNQQVEQPDSLQLLVLASELSDTYGAIAVEQSEDTCLLTFDCVDERDAALNALTEQGITAEINTVIDAPSDLQNLETQNADNSIDLSSEIEPATEEDPQESVIKIAVLDTGIASVENIDDEKLKESLLEGYSTISDSYIDDNGHGTVVSSLIADEISEYYTGNSKIKIIPIKVLDASGAGTTSSVYEGLKIAMEQDVDIINMSFGSVGHSNIITNAINEAYNKGITTIVSAGNDNANTSEYVPANIESAITVGGSVLVTGLDAEGNTKSEYTKAAYSNYGPNIDFSALSYYKKTAKESTTEEPGANEVSYENPGFEYEGTSISCAYVSSYAAILKAKEADEGKHLSEEDLYYSLQSSAADLGDEGFDEWYGNGFLSAKELNLYEPETPTEHRDLEVTLNTEGEKDLTFNMQTMLNYSPAPVNAFGYWIYTIDQPGKYYYKSANQQFEDCYQYGGLFLGSSPVPVLINLKTSVGITKNLISSSCASKILVQSENANNKQSIINYGNYDYNYKMVVNGEYTGSEANWCIPGEPGNIVSDHYSYLQVDGHWAFCLNYGLAANNGKSTYSRDVVTGDICKALDWFESESDKGPTAYIHTQAWVWSCLANWGNANWDSYCYYMSLSKGQSASASWFDAIKARSANDTYLRLTTWNSKDQDLVVIGYEPPSGLTHDHRDWYADKMFTVNSGHNVTFKDLNIYGWFFNNKWPQATEILNNNGTCTLENVELAGATGNGITNTGNLTINNSIVRNNGQGIWNCESATLNMSNSSVYDNSANGIVNQGTASYTGGDIRNNSHTGIYNISGTFDVKGNIHDNGSYGIFLDANWGDAARHRNSEVNYTGGEIRDNKNFGVAIVTKDGINEAVFSQSGGSIYSNERYDVYQNGTYNVSENIRADKVFLEKDKKVNNTWILTNEDPNTQKITLYLNDAWKGRQMVEAFASWDQNYLDRYFKLADENLLAKEGSTANSTKLHSGTKINTNSQDDDNFGNGAEYLKMYKGNNQAEKQTNLNKTAILTCEYIVNYDVYGRLDSGLFECTARTPSQPHFWDEAGTSDGKPFDYDQRPIIYFNESRTPVHVHNWVAGGSIVRKTSCELPGLQRYKCSGCGVDSDILYIYEEATGHQPVNGGTDVCHTKCEKCGEILSNTHQYTDTIIQQPTCSKPGVVRHTCSCGYYYDTNAGYKEHVLVDGGTKDCHSKCSECGETVSSQHEFTVETLKPSTCTEKGLARYTCACGYTCERPVEAYGHYEVNGGTKECHTKCDNCGAILSSAHNFTTTTVKAATCTQNGIERHTCSCGYYYETTIPALGHTGNEGGAVTRAASCTQEGYRYMRCTRCHQDYGSPYKYSGALGHTGNEGGTVTQGVSCTQDGYRYMRCTRCHQDYGSPYKYANAYGHDYEAHNIGWVTWDDPDNWDRFKYHATETHQAYIAAATREPSAKANIDDTSSGLAGTAGSRVNMSFIGSNGGVNHFRAKATVTPGDHYITCTPATGFWCAHAWIATCTRHRCKHCGHTYDTWNPSN